MKRRLVVAALAITVLLAGLMLATTSTVGAAGGYYEVAYYYDAAHTQYAGYMIHGCDGQRTIFGEMTHYGVLVDFWTCE